MLELENQLPFDSATAEDFFRQVPARPAVCAVIPHAANAQPFLIRTQDLRRRLQRMLGPEDPTSKRLNLREFAKSVRYRLTGSRFEQTLTFYQNAKLLNFGRYRDLLRMRPPAVLKVSLKNAYPRCFVTRRIPTNTAGMPIAGAYYGPFEKRKVAERFAEGVLDFFKVRRCQIKIRRDPTFPGCLYSEMKMCLAPCFAGCSKEEYSAEVGRLVNFLDTGGESLRDALGKEREQASEDLDFEKAHVLHKRLEKLDGALRSGPELARKVSDINAVILQRGAEEQTIAAYAVRNGFIADDPLTIRFGEMASNPKSAEELFRDYLETAQNEGTGAASRAATTTGFVGARHVYPEARRAVPAAESTPPTKPPVAKYELSEHLWLVARWYYDHERTGEIFFHTESVRQPGWPYRRILRACSRLLAPEPETPLENKLSEASNTADQTPATTQNPEKQTSESASKTKSSQRDLFDKSSNEGVT